MNWDDLEAALVTLGLAVLIAAFIFLAIIVVNGAHQ